MYQQSLDCILLMYTYQVRIPKYYILALAKIFAETEACFEKLTDDFLAEASATFLVKSAAALSLKTGIDFIAIAMVFGFTLQE